MKKIITLLCAALLTACSSSSEMISSYSNYDGAVDSNTIDSGIIEQDVQNDIQYDTYLDSLIDTTDSDAGLIAADASNDITFDITIDSIDESFDSNASLDASNDVIEDSILDSSPQDTGIIDAANDSAIDSGLTCHTNDDCPQPDINQDPCHINSCTYVGAKRQCVIISRGTDVCINANNYMICDKDDPQYGQLLWCPKYQDSQGCFDSSLHDCSHCPADFGNCDYQLENGCETYLNTVDHCGSCNTSCVNTDCVKNTGDSNYNCGAQILSTTMYQNTPCGPQLQSDGQYVFWEDSNGIQRYDLTNGVKQVLSIDLNLLNNPVFIASNGIIYVVNNLQHIIQYDYNGNLLNEVSIINNGNFTFSNCPNIFQNNGTIYLFDGQTSMVSINPNNGISAVIGNYDNLSYISANNIVHSDTKLYFIANTQLWSLDLINGTEVNITSLQRPFVYKDNKVYGFLTDLIAFDLTAKTNTILCLASNFEHSGIISNMKIYKQSLFFIEESIQLNKLILMNFDLTSKTLKQALSESINDYLRTDIGMLYITNANTLKFIHNYSL